MSEFAHPAPCYILGIESQIGLSLIRELGAAGIPVIGIAVDPKALGLESNYLTAGVVLEAPRTDAGLAQLRTLAAQYGPGYLLTVSEANNSWLIANRGALGGLVPLIPEQDAFAVVLDKARTLSLAASLGIAVPQGACPRSWDEVEALARSFPFPAVLKWADPNAVAGRLGELGIELVKAEYVYTPDEFLAVARRYQPVGAWPLVQEYCAGTGLGQFFFMHKGEAVRRFQHLRVAEWPPEGGFSSVCDAVPLERFAALQEDSIRLLQAIGWEGVAMVEYRYDPVRDRAVLMEVNGRFWGSFPLASYAGAGFGLLTYYLQGVGKMPALPALNNGLRCRMVATEIKRLRRILLQPGLIRDRSFRRRPVHEVIRFVVDFLRPSVRYYVWNWRDMKPFFRDVRNALGL